MTKQSSKITKWLENQGNLLSSIASLFAIIAGIAGFIFYFSHLYVSNQIKRDAEFSGIWTNPSEGCIGCEFNNDPKRPIVLNLEAKNGYISGWMDASSWLVPEDLATLKEKEDVTKMAMKIIFSSLNVDGELFLKKAKWIYGIIKMVNLFYMGRPL